MFLWHLHQLKWKLMIVIMKLRIKSLPNLVGRQGYVLLLSGTVILLDIMLLDNTEPTSYGEAMVSPDSDEWLEAIKSERGSMFKTRYRLWKNYLMVVRLLDADGF